MTTREPDGPTPPGQPEVLTDLGGERSGDDPVPTEVEHATLKDPVTWLPTVVETGVAVVLALVLGAVLIALSDR